MVVVDSSGWIEYLLLRPNAKFFRAAVEDTARLVVPAICLTEVTRYLTRAANRDIARDAAVNMRRATVVDLDADLADLAARLSLKHGLALADAIVYATAQNHKAVLLTQDEDFAKLPGVRYVRRK